MSDRVRQLMFKLISLTVAEETKCDIINVKSIESERRKIGELIRAN